MNLSRTPSNQKLSFAREATLTFSLFRFFLFLFFSIFLYIYIYIYKKRGSLFILQLAARAAGRLLKDPNLTMLNKNKNKKNFILIELNIVFEQGSLRVLTTPPSEQEHRNTKKRRKDSPSSTLMGSSCPPSPPHTMCVGGVKGGYQGGIDSKSLISPSHSLPTSRGGLS